VPLSSLYILRCLWFHSIAEKIEFFRTNDIRTKVEGPPKKSDLFFVRSIWPNSEAKRLVETYLENLI